MHLLFIQKMSPFLIASNPPVLYNHLVLYTIDQPRFKMRQPSCLLEFLSELK